MITRDDIALGYWRTLPPWRVSDIRAFEDLPEYSTSNPTGVVVGKMWRRHNGADDESFVKYGGIPRWVICRYEEAKPRMHRVLDPETRTYEDQLVPMCKIVTYRPVVRVRMGRA